MARLPDGIVAIYKGKDGHKNEFEKTYHELIMCKNCKHWDAEDTIGDQHFCPKTGCCEPPNFWCADGERRENDG